MSSSLLSGMLHKSHSYAFFTWYLYLTTTLSILLYFLLRLRKTFRPINDPSDIRLLLITDLLHDLFIKITSRPSSYLLLMTVLAFVSFTESWIYIFLRAYAHDLGDLISFIFLLYLFKKSHNEYNHKMRR